MTDQYVWAIFVAESTAKFPNFYPIGMFSSREQAIEELEALPKDMNYQLLSLPMNRMFAYYHKKSGKLVGMDGIYHEHFHYKNEE